MINPGYTEVRLFRGVLARRIGDYCFDKVKIDICRLFPEGVRTQIKQAYESGVWYAP